MIRLLEVIQSMECDCCDTTVPIFGKSVKLCASCVNTLFNNCFTQSYNTPHCVSIHKNGNNRLVMSMCTGTVMRSIKEDDVCRWVDSATEQDPPNMYSSILSEICMLIPLVKYINPTSHDIENGLAAMFGAQTKLSHTYH
jgi:hypothetical protein